MCRSAAICFLNGGCIEIDNTGVPPASSADRPLLLPDVPDHPEPMVCRWSEKERKVIIKYGQDCAAAIGELKKSDTAQTRLNETPGNCAVNTPGSLDAASGSIQDFEAAADLVDAIKDAETNGEALGLILEYRQQIRAGLAAQPAQAGTLNQQEDGFDTARALSKFRENLDLKYGPRINTQQQIATPLTQIDLGIPQLRELTDDEIWNSAVDFQGIENVGIDRKCMVFDRKEDFVECYRAVRDGNKRN